jgi:hypothetical protein
MERLTDKVRNFDGTASAKESLIDEKYHYPSDYCSKILTKLADYEDKQEQGLLIELPLKVGDVVYGYLPSYHREDGEDEIAPFLITNLTITQNKKRRWTKKYGSWLLRNGKTCPVGYDFSFEDIGKKYFLTRYEAEEALAKMGE